MGGWFGLQANYGQLGRGDSGSQFTGVFNGGGYLIYNLV